MNNESADEPPLSDRIRSGARTKALAARFNPFGAADKSNDRPLPLSASPSSKSITITTLRPEDGSSSLSHHHKSRSSQNQKTSQRDVADQEKSDEPPPAPPPVDAQGEGEESSTMTPIEKDGFFESIWTTIKMIIMYNVWINWLLVFVPVGIALGALIKAKGDEAPVSPSVVFAVNAIAIIPLAGLLAFATESVASKMGDTIGALMNVTFGNAVELIIFIIALVAGEIRIVQASLLGSILANLLLILGMCFLFGGLRFREQLYNSTVGQMSACLLSLSVISLLLPTAFHFSFNSASQTKADKVVVKVSRGTSVILLFVYVLYLLFQLKSHAYMYESTPQHLIDEESHPGVLADFMNSSSSSSDTSGSDTDSDSSSGSHTTAYRIKRAFRRRRKSSISSKDTTSAPSIVRTPSSVHSHAIEEFPMTTSPMEIPEHVPRQLEPVLSGDEADDDNKHTRTRRGTETSMGVYSRDFQTENRSTLSADENKRRRKKRSKRHSKKSQEAKAEMDAEKAEHEVDTLPVSEPQPGARSPPRVGFAAPPATEVTQDTPSNSPRKPFALRSIPLPAMPRVLSTTVFSQPRENTLPAPETQGQGQGSGLRRTNSLPDRLNSQPSQSRPAAVTKASGLPISAKPLPHLMPVPAQQAVDSEEEEKEHLSRNAAIILLLVSTGLVAACAEFLVDSINYLVETSGVSQTFIGLIILPIVGNAAEHVTAVTVASKNKMDLAIGVSLGSSIQIALFVTPIVVLLGWCLDTDMSLYFSLFETVSLFASAFIVNYLMIDGRSNYLEGALLLASYIIIALAAFFYPSCENLSGAAGPADSSCLGRVE